MEYRLIRARKRTLSLQVNGAGEVIARAPLYLPKFLIDKFVRDKSAWIVKRLTELAKPVSPRVQHFTENELKTFIHREVKKYLAHMQLVSHGIRFTHVRSYWGTCAPSGVLSFNLALRFTPKSVVSYVVVHELAHLRWKGHGTRFWNLVTKTCPQATAMRAHLRAIPRFI